MLPLDVINRALARLGALQATSLADTAKNAARAIAAYAQARDETMRMVDWPCITKRQRLLGWDEQATPWALSTAYVVGDRCTNDTAKTYQCTVAGVSAAAGGPTGTSAGITDGTVTWAYQEASTALNNWCWRINTAYVVGDLVSNNVGKVYVCITAGTSAGSGGPTGLTADITDNTVHWRWYGTPGENLTLFSFVYIYPSDCLKVQKIIDQGAAEEGDPGVQYVRERNMIYCDQDDSYAKYTVREEDPTNWDDILQTCIALKLAHEIAFDLTKDNAIVSSVFDELGRMLATGKNAAMAERVEGQPEPGLWVDA